MFEKLIPNPIARYESNEKQQSDAAKNMGFVPDIVSTLETSQVWFHGEIRREPTRFEHKAHLLNNLGIIPIVSTVTGAYRTLVGVAYLIKSLACFILDAQNQDQHKEGLKIAAASIGRGLLEMIPVIGNLFTINIDVSRMMQRWAEQGYPYADSNTIPIINEVDELFAMAAFIPGLGAITGSVRILGATSHLLVNIPPALAGNRFSQIACKKSLLQMGQGVIEAIPVAGTIYAIRRMFDALNTTARYEQ